MTDNSFASRNLFTTLNREATLTERVIEQLEDLIVARRLQAGDRLPPERELADLFGVSRTVVRESIRALTAKGLLRPHAGRGSVVTRPTAASVAQSMSLFLSTGHANVTYDKVSQVRRLLEVEIAGLAASQHTDEDLTNLQTILDEAAQQVDDEDPYHFAQTDVAFHIALAHATHNELFALLLDSLADIMHEIRVTGFNVVGTPARALSYHRAIFAQVKAGNVNGARQAMLEHLDESEATQRQVVAQRLAH